MTETELKGNWEVSWYGVNCIIADFQEIDRGKEGMAILINNEWHSTVTGF